jgi:hypothetical protein
MTLVELWGKMRIKMQKRVWPGSDVPGEAVFV